MRKIGFTQEEIRRLSYESIHYEHHIVRRRMQALLLKSLGLRHYEIAEILGISETTLQEYFDLYLTGGVEALEELHYQGKANPLRERKDEIITALEENPPATLKEARVIIQKVTMPRMPDTGPIGAGIPGTNIIAPRVVMLVSIQM